MRGVVAGLTIALVLGGCGIAVPGLDEPVEMPSGPPQLLPGAPEPDDAIAIVADGVADGRGWRMLSWESDGFTCRQLDFIAISKMDCGRPPRGVPTFKDVMTDADFGGVLVAHGIVSDQAEVVVAVTEDGQRIEGRTVPISDPARGGRAFVLLYSTSDRLTSLIAYGAAGQVLDERPLQ